MRPGKGSSRFHPSTYVRARMRTHKGHLPEPRNRNLPEPLRHLADIGTSPRRSKRSPNPSRCATILTV